MSGCSISFGSGSALGWEDNERNERRRTRTGPPPIQDLRRRIQRQDALLELGDSGVEAVEDRCGQSACVSLLCVGEGGLGVG